MKVLEKQLRPVGINLVDSQGPERQRFAGFSVDQEHFSIQYHTVASREGLRDVVLEMRYLKTQTQCFKNTDTDRINKVNGQMELKKTQRTVKTVSQICIKIDTSNEAP